MNEMQGLMSSITSLPLCFNSPRKDSTSPPDPEDGHPLADVAFTEEEDSSPSAPALSESQAQRIAADPPPPQRPCIAEEEAEELNRLVSDAQLYLQKDLGLKSNDSLLFIHRDDETQSEAESTPADSPTHCPAMPEEDSAAAAPASSSFGLHSPFASSEVQEEDVEELLRQLQSSTSMLFEENTLCLDPDIIDLTIIPPPCDDGEGKTLLDQETGQRREFYAPDADQNEAADEEEADGIVFSAHHADPPSEDDLSAYIIPPPPPSSTRAVEEQNRVLARFRKAAEEIRHMMAHGGYDSMHSVSKFCTIPRRHDDHHARPSIASLVTPVREKAFAAPEEKDSETGVHWRPQPPPRVKRNSIVAVDAHHGPRELTSQSDPPTNGHHSANCDPQEPPSSNGHNHHNGVNGHHDKPDGDFYVNGEYNGYDSSEFQAACCEGKNGLSNGGCVCSSSKKKSFLSYHHSLPRKAYKLTAVVENNGLLRPKLTFTTAQQEIADMIENLDLACSARLQECAECLPPGRPGLGKARDTLVCESRQFVTASKLFVKSITESSDKMEEHLAECVALLDRIFALGELVVLEMTLPSQIGCLADKLKEMAVAYSRTVQAAHSAAASGEIPNSDMAGLMQQATSLANSLTVLMRTLRTFSGP